MPVATQCRYCAYWQESARADDAGTGECHRFPPVFRPSDSQFRFPVTDAPEWCGEFESRAG